VIARRPGDQVPRSATDAEVAARIRQRRVLAGMTQTELGRHLGVTYQQIHKYENCLNRLSAGQLFRICVALGCTVGDLFEGIEA
jgi:transcriptional regulator with XRE-family HTH domain